MMQPSEINKIIAARIIREYEGIKKKENSSPSLVPKESMWGTLRLEHYSALRSLIESANTHDLAIYLSRIFRTETVNGYSYGTTFNRWPHRWCYLPVAIELSAVTLAECLGLLRAETHEQGSIAFWRKLMSEDELIEKLENYFGFRIESPRVGDPRGIIFGGRFLTRETCSHLYSAHRMTEVILRQKMTQPLRIVEIGGGYGGTCYWLRRLLGNQVERYVIVDLPEVGVVQSFFLGSLEPESLIIRSEELSGIVSPIQLIPHFELDSINFRPNIVINQDSMPEMPESEVSRYIGWLESNLDGLFISFNQEAYSPWKGELQVHVPSIVMRHPCFKRLSRETSWDRRGYVEEVYSTCLPI